MKLKEFLSVRGIEFESINVLEDAAGLAELRRLGARSVPVLSRGDAFVFAQNFADVVKFLGLHETTGPTLAPGELVERLDCFLSTAARIIGQMPDAMLDNEVPNRPRTYRVLGHHIFRIPDTFLDVVGGASLTYESLTARPPDAMRTTADIVEYGETVRGRLSAWWDSTQDKAAAEIVQPYYGPQRLHDYLERTTWHAGQHVRQWMMLLEMARIEPDGPLTDADLEGLPMPASVWDG